MVTVLVEGLPFDALLYFAHDQEQEHSHGQDRLVRRHGTFVPKKSTQLTSIHTCLHPRPNSVVFLSPGSLVRVCFFVF